MLYLPQYRQARRVLDDARLCAARPSLATLARAVVATAKGRPFSQLGALPMEGR